VYRDVPIHERRQYACTSAAEYSVPLEVANPQALFNDFRTLIDGGRRFSARAISF
jgi:hypothetical protein